MADTDFKFKSEPPLFIKHTDVSSIRGNILIAICTASNKVAPNQTMGATKTRGIWKLHVKSAAARISVLTHGLTINNRRIDVHHENPYLRNFGEVNEKIVIKGLPLELENCCISDFLSLYPQIETRSHVMYSKEKYTSDNTFSPFYNGERYIFVKENFTPPLPKEAIVANHHCQIFHRTQKLWCLRCRDSENRHGGTDNVDSCDAYEHEKEAVVFKSRFNVLSNFFMCDVKIWNQTFKSAEHAYQWCKATELLNNDLAEKIIKAPYAKDAKALATDAFSYDEMQTWSKIKLKMMRDILAAKATSCELFRTTLLKSGNQRLVEAGESDLYWSSGLNPYLAATTKHQYYPGSNNLGILLEEIRDVYITLTAGAEQCKIDDQIANNGHTDDASDAIKYDPILDLQKTQTTSDSAVLSLKTLSVAAQGPQLSPRTPTSRARSGIGSPGVSKLGRSREGTPKRRRSPDHINTPKKQCTPVSSPVKQTISDSTTSDPVSSNPKEAGDATESGDVIK